MRLERVRSDLRLAPLLVLRLSPPAPELGLDGAPNELGDRLAGLSRRSLQTRTGSGIEANADRRLLFAIRPFAHCP
jgi:hypothetical protein